MDTDLLKAKLQEEATCSICLGFYTDPVLLDCGHNFCRSCINRCWKEFPTNTACPQCRKAVQTKNCRANRPLANVVELLKQLNNQGKEESGEKICRRHPESTEVAFCKEDKICLCLMCEESEQHKDHHVVLLKDAAREYKDRFRRCIEVLQNEKKEILTHKLNSIRESEELMKRTETERQKTLTVLRQLHHFLADQENYLLTKIQVVAKDIVSKRNEQLCKLSAELFTLQNTVRQLEVKCQQPDIELLQDAEKVLEKCEKRQKFKPLEAVPLELKWEIWELRDLNVLLEGAVKHFVDTLQGGYMLQKATVSFDPESAHPQVLLSSDGKSLRWTQTVQEVPKSPKRFDRHFCVMGCQEFTSGRHFWDVIVRGKEDWAVGVATGSVKRKGFPPLTAEAGFFAMGKATKPATSASNPEPSDEVRKFRISLNCAGGQVAFYDVEKARKVYSFSQVSFHRETLYPFFWLRREAQISLCIN